MVEDSEGGMICNFEAAEIWLAMAKDAYATGDEVRCLAACRLVIVALGLDYLFNGMPRNRREK